MACVYHFVKTRNASSLPIDILNFSNSQDSTNIAANTSTSEYLLQVEHILLTKVVVVTCVLGVFGNLAALILLTKRQRRARSTNRRSQTGADLAIQDTWALRSLATSDILFCLAVLPHSVVNIDMSTYVQRVFSLYYIVYAGAVVNTLILTSTYLLVTLTLHRYMNLCHPLTGGRYFRAKSMKACIVLSVVFGVTLSLPRFWFKEIRVDNCLNKTGQNITVYYPGPGQVQRVDHLLSFCDWMYFAIHILVPVAVLSFCNTRIVTCIRRSRRGFKTDRVLTTVLVYIILAYLVLVSPAEIIKFFLTYQEVYTWNADIYMLAVTIANTCQAVHFSTNYLSYLVLNKACRRMLCKKFVNNRV